VNPVVDLVFFYGTLLKPFGRTRTLAIERDLVFLGRGSVPGALYEVGIYPALVPDRSARVVGELHEMSHPGRVLQTLDDYEGCRMDSPDMGLYAREIVPVTLDDGAVVEAWAYFYNAPLGQARPIASGDYLDHLRIAAPGEYAAPASRRFSAS